VGELVILDRAGLLKASERLIEEYARLLKSHEPLVGRYARAFLWCGAPYDELYHAGWLGLRRAVRLYDPHTFQNGLTAYAIHWIRGELFKFVSKNKSLVRSPRTEHSDYSVHLSAIGHFGNVAVGKGEINGDVSLHIELDGAADNFDDEVAGGFPLDLQVDLSLENDRGDFFWERRLRHLHGRDRFIGERRLAGDTLEEVGRELGISAERVRQIQNRIERPPTGLRELDQYKWVDHQARQFQHDCKMFCEQGVGFFYRNQSPPHKCPRQILPYTPPASLVKATVLGPGEYYDRYNEKVGSFQRLERARYVSETERNKQQDDWPEWKDKRQRARAPKWKLKARAALKAEQESMFWQGDNLRDYEIRTEPCYSRALLESYKRPHRVPWLTAPHRLIDKHGKPVGAPFEHSPSLIGESDYGGRDIGHCIETWTDLGDCHCVPKEIIGKEIKLYKPRKRDIRAHLKPDSMLVRLYWVRVIIAWHYLKYWMHPATEKETRHAKRKAARKICA
jgi:RNA polymerase sigma factor (sigma-70 family)